MRPIKGKAAAVAGFEGLQRDLAPVAAPQAFGDGKAIKKAVVHQATDPIPTDVGEGF